MKDPIIITGAPRSGKTMIAGILHICEAFSGKVDNKFENKELETQLIEPALFANKLNTKGHVIEVDTQKLFLPRNWKSRVEQLLIEQGYSGGPWFIKSNEVAVMWPIWNYAFPRAKYIIVRRRIGDIVSSCMKTAYMDTYTNERDWILMCRQYERLYVEMINEGLNCKVVWPHRMSYGDYQQIYETLDWVGLKWKTEILQWVDPKFFKVRSKK